MEPNVAEPTILFRGDNNDPEAEIASEYFPLERQRANCYESLIIGRYSVLPFYKELWTDLRINGSTLINSVSQHDYIANFEYYDDVKQFTPQTWDDTNFHEADWEGPFIVKGVTTSKKLQWKSMMFALTKKNALYIASKLLKDGDMQGQKIIYRKYVELITFEKGMNDLPFSNEWRFFFYKNTQLTFGYYWSIAKKSSIKKAYMTVDGVKFANKIANLISKKVNFFCLDIAETAGNEWILIEVNDAQMSGLQEVDPRELYGNLKKALKNEYSNNSGKNKKSKIAKEVVTSG